MKDRQHFTFSVIFVGLTLFGGFGHFSFNLLLVLEDLFGFPKSQNAMCGFFEFAMICFQYSSLMLVAPFNNPQANVPNVEGAKGKLVKETNVKLLLPWLDLLKTCFPLVLVSLASINVLAKTSQGVE